METIVANRLGEQAGEGRYAVRRGGPAAAPGAVGGTLAVDVHRSMADVQLLWRSMEATQCCPVHQTYDWCRCWVEATSPDLAVAVGRIDGEAAFLLPLEIVARQGVRVARYIATPFSNINNGIFTEAGQRFLAGASAAGALSSEFRRQAPDIDCLVLDKLPVDWRGERHPMAGLPHVRSASHAFQITLGCSFDALLARTNGKRKRKKYRTSTRRLEAAGGWEHIIAETAEDALDLLEVFFVQKGERLRAQGLPDVFAPEGARLFFRNLARQMPHGDRHLLQLHAIRLGGADGRLCAIAGLSRKGDHLICQFASVDDKACPDSSPGELLFHLMIEKACGEQAAVFDFGIGDQRYKRSWCDVETPHHDVVLPLTARGRLYAAGYRSAIAAKRFVKQNPKALGIANRLRALSARR